jgi:RNA polymerase sigma factor (sigma-70 family)
MNNDLKNTGHVWRILHSYESEVFGYIKHAVGSMDVARDLYQDVYLQALQHIPELDPERSLKNWLMTVTRNRVINYFRERSRRGYQDLSDDLMVGHLHHHFEFENAIQHALDQLPAGQREVIIAREMDGLNYKELAEKLNLSEPAVTSLLDRARKNLHKYLMLYFMPDWFKANAEKLKLEDLTRFVDSFESAESFLDKIQRRSQMYFESVSTSWDEIRNRFIDIHQLNNILSKIGSLANLNVLDLGSGTGFVSAHCGMQNSQVVSVDLNRAMLMEQRALNQRLGISGIHLIQGNISALPVKKKQFDLVFLTLVLHHINDPVAMLNQVANVLRNDGRLILIDFVHHKNSAFADRMHDLWLGFDPVQIKKWCKTSGLKEQTFLKWHSPENIQVFCQIFKKQPA